MRRFYVIPRTLLTGDMEVGYDYDAQQPVRVHTVRLFHPDQGGHAIDLPNGFLLMAVSFSHSERYEEMWHNHPDVAVLPHPTIDGHKKLVDHVGSIQHKFHQHHHDAIKGHETLGADDSDTIITLAAKAVKIHPLVKLTNVL